MTDTCPQCNNKVLPTDTFCPFCGKQVREGSPLTAPSPAATNRKDLRGSFECPFCYAIIQQEQKFCPNCGFQLPYEQQPKQPGSDMDASEHTTEQPNFTDTQTFGATTTVEVNEKRPWYKPPKTKRSKKNPIIWGYLFGWFLYVILRMIFSGLCCFLEVLLESRK